jgi:hypothetical protein
MFWNGSTAIDGLSESGGAGSALADVGRAKPFDAVTDPTNR